MSGTCGGGLFPPEHWAGAEHLAGHRYDPKKARALLAAAGYAEDIPWTSVTTSSDPFRVRLATVIQAQLERWTSGSTCSSYNWVTFFGDVKAGWFQIYSLTWVGIRTPDIFRYVFHSNSVPPDGANRGRYRSPETSASSRPPARSRSLSARPSYTASSSLFCTGTCPTSPFGTRIRSLPRGEVKGYRLAPDGNYDGLAAVEFHPDTAESPTRLQE